MSFPPSQIPSTNPQNIVSGGQVGLLNAARDPGPSDVSYTPGQSEWLNTTNGNYWKYKGVQIVSGSAQGVWELLTTVSETRDPNSGDNQYTIGTLWSNTSSNAFWALTSFSGTSANWTSLSSNPSPSGVLQLTPQDLNVVLPNGSGNININGGTSGFLTTVRTSTNTLTVKESGVLATLYGGLGTNSPTANGVLIGQGSSTVHSTSAGSAGQPLLAGGLGVDPNWGTLSVSFGGTGLTSLTAHYVLVGNGTSAVSLIAPSATSGVPLISQGASADPTYGTAVVAGGGTGATSFTAYSVLCAGTTSTGAFQNVSGLGTSGQVLTSNGAGALPTWQNVPGGASAWGSCTVNGDGTLTLLKGYNVTVSGTTITFTTALADGNYAVVWSVSDDTGNATVISNTTTTSFQATVRVSSRGRFWFAVFD